MHVSRDTEYCADQEWLARLAVEQLLALEGKLVSMATITKVFVPYVRSETNQREH